MLYKRCSRSFCPKLSASAVAVAPATAAFPHHHRLFESPSAGRFLSRWYHSVIHNVLITVYLRAYFIFAFSRRKNLSSA